MDHNLITFMLKLIRLYFFRVSNLVYLNYRCANNMQFAGSFSFLKKKLPEGGHQAPSISSCEYWFRRFKIGDFEWRIRNVKEGKRCFKMLNRVHIERRLVANARRICRLFGSKSTRNFLRFKAMEIVQNQRNCVL